MPTALSAASCFAADEETSRLLKNGALSCGDAAEPAAGKTCWLCENGGLDGDCPFCCLFTSQRRIGTSAEGNVQHGRFLIPSTMGVVRVVDDLAMEEENVVSFV